MRPIVRLLFANLRASTAVEYALIAGLISIAAIGAMSLVGQKVMNMLGPAANAMT